MILYKYLPPERIDVLRTGRIRYTQASLFDDPFECRPHVTDAATVADKREALDAAVARVGTDPEFADVMGRSPKGPQARPTMLLDWLSVTAGVLSLSEARDDLLMWAAYADGHQGFLVGFDSEHEVFRGDRTPQMGSLAPVQYRITRPTVSFDELDVPVAYFVKGDAWKHQREWRLCRAPEYAAEIIQTDGAPIFLFDIPAGAIAEVVVGCRACQQLTHDLAIALNTPLYAHVAVLQATIDPRHYSLNFQPVEAQDLAHWRAWSPPRAPEPSDDWQ